MEGLKSPGAWSCRIGGISRELPDPTEAGTPFLLSSCPGALAGVCAPGSGRVQSGSPHLAVHPAHTPEPSRQANVLPGSCQPSHTSTSVARGTAALSSQRSSLIPPPRRWVHSNHPEKGPFCSCSSQSTAGFKLVPSSSGCSLQFTERKQGKEGGKLELLGHPSSTCGPCQQQHLELFTHVHPQAWPSPSETLGQRLGIWVVNVPQGVLTHTPVRDVLANTQHCVGLSFENKNHSRMFTTDLRYWAPTHLTSQCARQLRLKRPQPAGPGRQAGRLTWQQVLLGPRPRCGLANCGRNQGDTQAYTDAPDRCGSHHPCGSVRLRLNYSEE